MVIPGSNYGALLRPSAVDLYPEVPAGSGLTRSGRSRMCAAPSSVGVLDIAVDAAQATQERCYTATLTPEPRRADTATVLGRVVCIVPTTARLQTGAARQEVSSVGLRQRRTCRADVLVSTLSSSSWSRPPSPPDRSGRGGRSSRRSPECGVHPVRVAGVADEPSVLRCSDKQPMHPQAE